MKNSRPAFALLSLSLLSVAIAPLIAQPPVTSRALLISMALNAKRVVQYEWKQRVTVIQRGNPSEPIVDQIRFDSSGQMQRTVISAPEQKQMSGMLKLLATGTIKPADSMTMLVNATTHLATHVDIKTDYEGSPMTIAQDYSAVPDGPNMMKTMRVSVPQKKIAVNIDSYDFARQSSSNINPAGRLQ